MLTQLGRDIGRGRGKDHVDLAKQLQHPGAKPSPQALRLDDPGARDLAAGEEPVARAGVEILRPRAQVGQMQVGALRRRDQEGRGTRARRLWHGYAARHAQRSGHGGHRGERLGLAVAGEVVVGDGDP